jgi:hypothetical protein
VTNIKTKPNLVPQILATGFRVWKVKGKLVFTSILDTRGTGPMINGRCISKGAIIHKSTGGEYKTMLLVSFDRSKRSNLTICVYPSSPSLADLEKLLSTFFVLLNVPMILF